MLDEKLEAARNEFSFASEQFRNLKIQLRQAESDTPLKVFTVSSPDSQDGKSLISTNLAFSFAQDPGCRVLIIDCDLRKPTLARYLGVTEEPGLVAILVIGCASAAAVFPATMQQSPFHDRGRNSLESY